MPAAPVQFFNPAAIPAKQPKAAAGGAPGADGAPAEQMANMRIGGAGAQFILLYFFFESKKSA
jgi:hypothetical protein